MQNADGLIDCGGISGKKISNVVVGGRASECASYAEIRVDVYGLVLNPTRWWRWRLMGGLYRWTQVVRRKRRVTGIGSVEDDGFIEKR